MRLAYALMALLLAAPALSESAEIASELAIKQNSSDWGGLSGVDYFPENGAIVLVSDRGTIWHGLLKRDLDGNLTGIDALQMARILTSKGEPVEDYNIDAEAIDHDEDGNFFISFESNSRVSKFADWNSAAELIPNAEEFAGFGFNSGPEAMTIGEAGEVWLAPERSGELERPYPLFQYDGRGWKRELGIPRKPPFLLVGMDYDPKTKRLYILERALHLGVRFRNRVRAFDYTENGFVNEKTIWENPSSKYGNLEGISFYERDGGRYLLLVADDNYLPLFANYFVELELN